MRKPNNPAPGTRVRVTIPERNWPTWNTATRCVLQGNLGTVEATGREHSEGKVCVRFDEELPAAWSYGSPISCWWLDADEIEVLADAPSMRTHGDEIDTDAELGGEA